MAAAQHLRSELLAAALDIWEAEDGPFSDGELDDAAARQVGELLGINASRDLVDAHVAILVQPGGQVLTSDKPDILGLLRTRGVDAAVVGV